MLTIQMPDRGDEAKHRKQKRTRWQALGYLVSAVLILTSLGLAYSTPVWFVPVVAETWWIWAVLSWDPAKR